MVPGVAGRPGQAAGPGVPLEDGAAQPKLTEYPDLLAIRFQDLIDRAGKKRAQEAIEDLLTHAEGILMADPDDWGTAIVETDEVQMLIADATDEILEPVAPLDPKTRVQLQGRAEQASLRQILALI